MKLTIGLQQSEQNIVTVKRSTEQATIGLCWSEFLFEEFEYTNGEYLSKHIPLPRFPLPRFQCP